MMRYMRQLFAPIVVLLAILPAKALYKQSKLTAAEKSDCYSPYEGKHLLRITECTQDMAALTKSLMSNGSCICMGDGGELLMPADGCCIHAPVICEAQAGSNLKDKFTEQVELLNENAGNYYRANSGNTEDFVESNPGANFIGGVSEFYTRWRNLDAQQTRIKSLVEKCGIATIEQIGKTHQKRPISAIRFTGENYQPGNLKVLMTFQLHAREWISGMSGVYVIEKIVQALETNPNFINDSEIVVIPMSNPDGFVYSGESDRMWRKNMRDNGKRFCRGVDLNRNFPVDWNGRSSTSNNECSEIYVGDSTGSEPETQAIMKVIDETPLSLHIDFHSYGELILAPWSYTQKPHPERSQINILMKVMEKAIKDKTGKMFTYGGSEQLYPASGVCPDYSSDKGAWGFTVELSPASQFLEGGFLLPARKITSAIPVAWSVFRASFEWMKANDMHANSK